MDDGIEEERRVEVVHINLFADQHESRLLEIDGLAIPFDWRQTRLGDLIDIATRMTAAEIESLPVFFGEERQRVCIGSFHKSVGMTRRSDKTDRDLFVPQFAKRPPRSRHRVEFLQVPRSNHHPVIGDQLERVILYVINVYFLESSSHSCSFREVFAFRILDVSLVSNEKARGAASDRVYQEFVDAYQEGPVVQEHTLGPCHMPSGTPRYDPSERG